MLLEELRGLLAESMWALQVSQGAEGRGQAQC